VVLVEHKQVAAVGNSPVVGPAGSNLVEGLVGSNLVAVVVGGGAILRLSVPFSLINVSIGEVNQSSL
jgi:hypothetical protein